MRIEYEIGYVIHLGLFKKKIKIEIEAVLSLGSNGIVFSTVNINGVSSSKRINSGKVMLKNVIRFFHNKDLRIYTYIFCKDRKISTMDILHFILKN